MGAIAKINFVNMSKVAIIIPVYNHAQALYRTLEAFRHQSFTESEIVIIDDASSDNPKNIVNQFSDLPIRYISWSKNRGAPAARNEGARMTTAPYLLFLDADARLFPQAIEQMVNALDTHQHIDFVYGNHYWGNKTFLGRPFDRDVLRQRNYIHTSSMLRRSAFPGFDESLKRFQDWDLWLTMSHRGSLGMWIQEFLFTIEPRKTGGMSHWLPSFMYRIPWDRIGWMPQEIQKYKTAELVIRKKHLL